ncbi:hypothetical protein CYMTET_21219 [Cymbomonas tetramitiformis]|uniref:Uncharacterized protein n=1 Tax=Cymbomonas tetramitiformis TaxID=36881 RepID=A0AAE0G2Z9_9CHLO|nr:hypothetical protein CYMTET_21219 [Cymbomonas tetramitiformis]
MHRWCSRSFRRAEGRGVLCGSCRRWWGHGADRAAGAHRAPTEKIDGRVYTETSTNEFPGGVTVLGAHACAVGDDSGYDKDDYNSDSTLKPAAARRAAMRKQIN